MTSNTNYKLTCIFIHLLFVRFFTPFRLTTRALIVPFSGPSVGPQTTAEQKELTKELRDGTYSSCIGWVIRQKAMLESDKNLQQMKSELGGLFKGFPRLTQGWALALVFIHKVGN